MGVAGASQGGHAVLIAGLAGMLAGALSMAIGEWLSVQSARELFAHQVKVEREELLAVPDEEEEELTLIYQAKGLTAEQARLMSQSIVGGEIGRAVDTLAREELGIDPDELGGSAWVAALTSFFLFALRRRRADPAVHLRRRAWPAVVASIVVSAVAPDGRRRGDHGRDRLERAADRRAAGPAGPVRGGGHVRPGHARRPRGRVAQLAVSRAGETIRRRIHQVAMATPNRISPSPNRAVLRLDPATYEALRSVRATTMPSAAGHR